MGDRRHHSTPLRLRACRKNNHKACEDDLADHGSHLTARPAEPCPNNLVHLQGCARSPIGFNPIPSRTANSRARHVPRFRFHRNVIIPLSSVPHSFPLCYNRPAVERTAKWELARVQAESAQAAAQSAASLQHGQSPAARTEDPSRYCPVCSQRLQSRRCKLICSVCGYYMSCADYY